MKTGFTEQENRRHHLVRSNRPKRNNGRMNAFLILARRKFLSKFTAHLNDSAFSRKPFIWLPFTGGISAFAVILPKPRE
jgi:hypothetical protein